jgi:LysM repeat protein
MTGALALSSVLLVGCSDPAPSHNVTVKKGQTLDDIGTAECGPSFLNITTTPRRNHIREFNDLSSDTVTPGQVLKVPDSLCYDTGDKIRDDKVQS